MKYYAIAVLLMLQGCVASGPHYPTSRAIYLEQNEYHPHYSYGNWKNDFNNHSHSHHHRGAYGRR